MVHQVICRGCKVNFKTVRSGGKFCSRLCYTTNNRQRKRPELSGKNNYGWKGGRTHDGFGYVLIHMPDHPDSTKKGYIREHRLVMANFLGRRLKKSEIVYHMNHVKDDNRLENLLLFENQSVHLAHHHTHKN